MIWIPNKNKIIKDCSMKKNNKIIKLINKECIQRKLITNLFKRNLN